MEGMTHAGGVGGGRVGGGAPGGGVGRAGAAVLKVPRPGSTLGNGAGEPEGPGAGGTSDGRLYIQLRARKNVAGTGPDSHAR